MGRFGEALGQSDPEAFVRSALGLLEASFRELALVALADWDRTGLVSHELYLPVTALQRPSWGSWNGLVAALRKARRAVLASGQPADRAKVEKGRLASVLGYLDEPAELELAPLAAAVHAQAPKRPRVADALTLPITLRNRIAHDQPGPKDPIWESAAPALRALVEWLDGRTPIALLGDHPAPWFSNDRAFVGLANDFSVRYAAAGKPSELDPTATPAVLSAFKRLLGAGESEERDLKKLLVRLAPEEIKGVLLGDYLVGRPVGEGGFARVHVAHQVSTGRRVALKILDDSANEEDRARFQQEAAFLSRFAHPNIVAVLGYGEDAWSPPREPEVSSALSKEPWFKAFADGKPRKCYIALEWIQGKTLDAIFQEGPRPGQRVLAEWFRQAAGALAIIHASGVIHRDVKPANLMVTEDGVLKLMDFGIARRVGPDATKRTQRGTVLGTKAYMSPEQLRSRTAEAEIGPATDVYSLAATFYELFTGTRLYEHDKRTTEEVATSKLEGDAPVRPRATVRGLPWELETILLGGLSTELSQRYASAEALARDVRHFLADEAIEKKRPSVLRRARLAYRRNRAITNVVALALLVLLGGGTVSSLLIQKQRDEALQARDGERAAKDDAIAARGSAELEAFAARTSLAENDLGRLWDLRDREHAKNWDRVLREAARVHSDTLALAARAPGNADPELVRRVSNVKQSVSTLTRHLLGEHTTQPRPHSILGSPFTPLCLARSPDGKSVLAGGTGGVLALWDATTGEPLRTFVGHSGAVKACAFSPDGDELLSASADRTLRLWDRSSGRLVRTWSFESHAAPTACAFSPDGREVLSAGQDYRLRLWDRATGRLSRTLEGHTFPVRACDFSPDGKLVASASDDRTLRIWERATGQLLRTFQHTERVTSCAFAPDAREVLSASEDDTLELRDLTTGRLLRTFEGHTGRVTVGAFSPDGKEVLSASADRTIRLWDRASGRLLRTFEGHDGSVTACTFLSDGRKLLSASEDRTFRLWDRATGTLERRSPGHASAVTACAFSPDDEEVLSASTDGTLELHDRRSGRLLRELVGHTQAVMACAFSPDGQELVSASADRTLRRWERATGRHLGTLEGHKRRVTACLFSDDGRALLSASDDGTLRLWDRATGRTLHVLETDGKPVTACAFSRDGQEVVAVSSDQMFRTWDRTTGERTTLFGAEGGGATRAFSPGNDHEVVTAFANGSIRLFDWYANRTLRTFEGPGSPMTASAVSPEGEVLSAFQWGTLELWDGTSGRSLRTFEGHAYSPSTCAFSHDGREVLSGAADNTLRLWDRGTGLRFPVHDERVSTCRSSPDGREVLLGCRNGTLELWDRTNGRFVRSFTGHKGAVTDCAFSPGGREVLSASEDRTLELWDRATGRLVRTFEGATEAVRACAFSPDGETVLSASEDETLRLHERSTGRLVSTFEYAGARMVACAFSPDGKTIVSASPTDLVLWDRATGGPRSFEGTGAAACAFSPDGEAVLSAAGNVLKLWDRATRRLVRTIEGHAKEIVACAFSADGWELISASRDRTIKLWDRTTGRLLSTLESPEELEAFSPSPDGGVVFVAGQVLHSRALTFPGVDAGSALGSDLDRVALSLHDHGRPAPLAADELPAWVAGPSRVDLDERGERLILSTTNGISQAAAGRACLRAAADAGSVGAMQRLAWALDRGLGGPCDPFGARELRERATRLGSAAPVGTLARTLAAVKDRDEQELEAAASRNEPDALLALAELHPERAMTYLVRGATLEDPRCLTRYADAIAPIDTEAAVRDLWTASARVFGPAARRLGDMGVVGRDHQDLLRSTATRFVDTGEALRKWRRECYESAIASLGSALACGLDVRLEDLARAHEGLAQVDRGSAFESLRRAIELREAFPPGAESDAALANDLDELRERVPWDRSLEPLRSAFSVRLRCLARDFSDPDRHDAACAAASRLRTALRENRESALDLAHQIGEVAARLGREPVGGSPGRTRRWWGELGLALEQVGDLEGALRAHERFLALVPRAEVVERASGLENAIRLLAHFGRRRELARRRREQRELAASPIEPDLDRARVLETTGASVEGQLLLADALAALGSASEIMGYLWTVSRNLDIASLAHEMGDLERAQAVAEACHAGHGTREDRVRSTLLLSRIRADMGQRARAQEVIAPALTNARRELVLSLEPSHAYLRDKELADVLASAAAIASGTEAVTLHCEALVVRGPLAAGGDLDRLAEVAGELEACATLLLARGEIAAAESQTRAAREARERATSDLACVAELEEDLALARRAGELIAGAAPVTTRDHLALARELARRGEPALDEFELALPGTSHDLEDAARAAVRANAPDKAMLWLERALTQDRERIREIDRLAGEGLAEGEVSSLRAERVRLVRRWIRARFDESLEPLHAREAFTRLIARTRPYQ